MEVGSEEFEAANRRAAERLLLAPAPRFACPIVTADEFLAALGRFSSEGTP